MFWSEQANSPRIRYCARLAVRGEGIYKRSLRIGSPPSTSVDDNLSELIVPLSSVLLLELIISPPLTPKYAMSHQSEVKELEKAFNESSWLHNHAMEPVIGHPDCPAAAEKHGVRGMPCYTALVQDYGNGRFGCRYEECRRFWVNSLDDAVRHMRYQHFDHRPFVCISWSV